MYTFMLLNRINYTFKKWTLKFFKLKKSFQIIVLIIFCCDLKKYTYFDVLTNILNHMQFDFNFVTVVLFNIIFK